jgi:hypothetical protein
VTSTCGKIWSANQCTLKEADENDISSPSIRQQAKERAAIVYQGLPPGGAVDPRSLPWPSQGSCTDCAIEEGFYSHIRPKLADIGYLERLVTITLRLEVPAVAGAVLKVKSTIIRSWALP